VEYKVRAVDADLDDLVGISACDDRVVLTTGTRAYRHLDGTAVVPLGLLGP